MWGDRQGGSLGGCAVLPGWMVVAQLSPLLSVLLQDIYSEPELCPAPRCSVPQHLHTLQRGLLQGFLPEGVEAGPCPAAYGLEKGKAGTATSP